MQVKDIMTAEVRTIAPDATVQEAAKKMDDENVGALPVCDGDCVIGLVTDRDIVIRSTSVGQDPSTTSVRDVMSAPITVARADQTIEEAAELMREQAIRRLVVVDAQDQLVGIVTADDMITGSQAGVAASVVRSISAVERPGL